MEENFNKIRNIIFGSKQLSNAAIIVLIMPKNFSHAQTISH
jgi:hypothetical protein